MRLSDVLVATALCGFQISLSGFVLPYRAPIEDVNALDKRIPVIEPIIRPEPHPIVNPEAPHDPKNPNSRPETPIQNPNSPGSHHSGGSDTSIRSTWSTLSERLKKGNEQTVATS